MPNELSAEQWAEIDTLILARYIIPALKLVKAGLGISLVDAMEIYHARYRQLREKRPDDFVCPDVEYWAGFYS